jgi:predicted component of type VI protein secretion system
MTHTRVRLDTPGGVSDLAPGSYVIGRAPECDFVIHSGLASRQHARLTVLSGGASIEDLGTPNGTFVNGRRLVGTRSLADADFIVIGDVALEISITAGTASGAVRPPTPRAASSPGPTLEGAQRHPTVPARAFEVLESTADSFFEQEQQALAERVLEGWLVQVLAAVRSGLPREPDGDEAALRQSVRLARALGAPRWVDYAIELSTVLERPLPGEQLDALEPVVQRVGVSGVLLDAYLARLGTPPLDAPAVRALSRLETWRAYARVS